MMRRFWSTLIAVVTVIASGSVVTSFNAAAASTPPGATVVLRVVSSPGDFIGQGKTWLYADGYSDGVLTIGGSEGGFGLRLLAHNTDYQVQLSAPAGGRLTTGVFNDARRAQFNGTHPGLWVAGEGRGCNSDTGSFVIRSIVTDKLGSVTELDASFTQYCDGSKAPLRGTLQYKAPPAHAVVLTSSHPVTVRGAPTTLTAQAPARSVVSFFDGSKQIGRIKADSHKLARFTTSKLKPGRHFLTARSAKHASPRVLQRVYSNKNSFWYRSVGGDGFAGGGSETFTSRWSTLSVSGTRKELTILVETATRDWQLTITAPTGKAIRTGSYTHLQSIATATAPGLFVAGGGSACNEEHGSMRIASLQATSRGKVTAIALTFKQYCDAYPGPLTGTVHITDS